MLQTSGGAVMTGDAVHPRFFSGFLTAPEQGAQGLLAVAAIARARYFTPTTAASLALRDPVVTSDGERLRFESFSGCCGVYARFDVLGEGLDGELLDRGTTNVDVNPPLQVALARVGGGEPLHLSVGADDLTVTTLDAAVVERKVTLPPRWVRGFAEAAVSSATMDLRAEVPAAEARRFLRGLPSSDRSVLWAVPSGRSMRLTTRPGPTAVCISGPQRLVEIERLLRFASVLRVYGPPSTGAPVASAWELVLDGARIVLTLSPELARGFSGEGGVLTSLAGEHVEADAARVLDLLAWAPGSDLPSIGDELGLPAERVRAAVISLGTAGRVGYDVADAEYFHRQLPYDPGRVEAANPRLAKARALVADGQLHDRGEGVVVVTRGDHVQHVRVGSDGAATCTCPWWAKYAGARGPCAHVLAVRIMRDGNAPRVTEHGEPSSASSLPQPR